MKQRKKIWILITLGDDLSKKMFEEFVKTKKGRPFKVPKQYSNGLVMLLASPDLNQFSLTNITCGMCADIRFHGVDEFIDNYDDIKRRYDSAIKNMENDFQDVDYLIAHEHEKKNHYSLVMPDGNVVGLWTFKGESDEKQLQDFINNWFVITSKDPIMYGHKEIYKRNRVCPKCGGILHYAKNDNTCYEWCINCHEQFVRKK